MAFINSSFARSFVAMFSVLLCGELSYKVKGDTIAKLYNVGDDIRLECYPYSYNPNNNKWYRNGSFLASRIHPPADNRIKPNYEIDYAWNAYGSRISLYSLSISMANIGDSARYKCFDHNGQQLASYDVHVIGCTCILRHHNDPDKEKVMCNLENFWTDALLRLNITVNENIDKMIAIQGNSFSFAMFRNKLYNSLHFELHQLCTNVNSSIRCMLSAQLTSPHPSTRYSTTPLIPTTQITRSNAPYTTSQRPISSAAISTGGHHTRQNKNSNQGKNLSDSDITMIIVIAGSVSILILIVLIVVLRCKQTKNRQGNKHNDILSVDGKDTKEHPEACYESVDDASQRGLRKSTSNEKMKDKSENQPNADHHGGMVENILYDSTDKIAEGSISRTEGPLDNALYAMPDKRKTLDRESKSGVIDGSSNAEILYGNSSIIISQQEQKRDNVQRGDQYENVEMPGPGGGVGAEEIPLYEMPDKAPQRNTLKTTPKAEQTSTVPKEEVVNLDALYAEVDKTKKK